MAEPNENLETLTIGEVADRTGVAASALRYYEREGLIPKARRRGGKRVWLEDVVDRLALIGLAKSAGFTVSEIRTLSTVSPSTAPGHVGAGSPKQSSTSWNKASPASR